jgi:hypothetical protein
MRPGYLVCQDSRAKTKTKNQFFSFSINSREEAHTSVEELEHALFIGSHVQMQQPVKCKIQKFAMDLALTKPSMVQKAKVNYSNFKG